MEQRQTAVEIQDADGSAMRTLWSETDSPLPPVAELERLHKFRPDLVDKVFNMVAEESIDRRNRFRQIDKYIFVQNMVSSVGAVLVALTAFGGSIYLASKGFSGTAIALVGTTLGVVVYAITRANKK